MKKIFAYTICLFLLGSSKFIVSAGGDVRPAEWNDDLCTTTAPLRVLSDTVALCIPNSYSAGYKESVNNYFVCEYEGWGYGEVNGFPVCCPPNWVAIDGGGCCPPDFPDKTDVVMGCENAADSDWLPVSNPIVINGVSVIVRNSGPYYVSGFDARLEARRATGIPDYEYLDGSTDNSKGCFTKEYYCLNQAGAGYKGPTMVWDYNRLTTPYPGTGATPFGYDPYTEGDAATCTKTCAQTADMACLPNYGWVRRNDTWQSGMNTTFIPPLINPEDSTGARIAPDDPSLVDYADVYNLLCNTDGSIKSPIPAAVGRDDATISGCGRIISYRAPDGSVLFRDPGAFPDLYTEFEKCQQCQGTVEVPTGNLWSEFGCIEPTASGIVNRIFQIAVGIAGGIIIYRILQAVVKLNLEEPTQEREAEIREIFTSIVVFLIVTLGSVVVLRFLVVNLLGFPLPSLFSF